jgi:tagatose-6-phosphate ketose/aldose isomerase
MDEKILGFTVQQLKSWGGIHTGVEISQQPDLWHKTFAIAMNEEKALSFFMEQCFALENLDVIFAGAGTSAFIGDCLGGIFQKNTGIRPRAIATTDIVTHPYHCFHPKSPTLLVSFARSGQSPESLAAVNLANQLCSSIYHLIITCNAEGHLAKICRGKNCHIITLPPESNDQGLAMTGSFTSMLLIGILLSKLPYTDTLQNEIDILCRYGRKLIYQESEKFSKICEMPFERAVFLGSGPLRGCAEECHLKLQELTDGRIVSKFDSFLGFRHGPRAVINAKTLMVYLLSTDPYVHNYEVDLITAVNKGEKGMCSIGICEKDVPDIDASFKIALSAEHNQSMDQDFLCVCNTLAGQILGFFKSLQLNLKPDSPSASGAITRVVEGVHIYPFSKQP